MAKVLVVISGVFLLTACQGPPRDPQCDFEAKKATAGPGSMADHVSGYIEVYNACMRAKGAGS